MDDLDAQLETAAKCAARLVATTTSPGLMTSEYVKRLYLEYFQLVFNSLEYPEENQS